MVVEICLNEMVYNPRKEHDEGQWIVFPTVVFIVVSFLIDLLCFGWMIRLCKDIIRHLKILYYFCIGEQKSRTPMTQPFGNFCTIRRMGFLINGQWHYPPLYWEDDTGSVDIYTNDLELVVAIYGLRPPRSQHPRHRWARKLAKIQLMDLKYVVFIVKVQILMLFPRRDFQRELQVQRNDPNFERKRLFGFSPYVQLHKITFYPTILESKYQLSWLLSPIFVIAMIPFIPFILAAIIITCAFASIMLIASIPFVVIAFIVFCIIFWLYLIRH